ncbi:hypothetical protein FZC66_18785 [Priestia megaterium]|nr:hypothetical protein FZC66_18785 [Priestia megaterium]
MQIINVREHPEYKEKAGFNKVFLCTDHIGYYEKYGFTYIDDGYHPWGSSSRIYESNNQNNHFSV